MPLSPLVRRAPQARGHKRHEAYGSKSFSTALSLRCVLLAYHFTTQEGQMQEKAFDFEKKSYKQRY
jgi:hypothetical protein